MWWDPPIKSGDDKENQAGGWHKARNSRIFVIASEAKQSLGILNLSLGIPNLFLEF